MFRVVGLGRRAESASHEDCIRHWVEVHAAIARDLPGLISYTVADLGPELDGRPARWDGMATLTFADREAYLRATRSEVMVRVAADSSYLRDRLIVFVEEEHVIAG